MDTTKETENTVGTANTTGAVNTVDAANAAGVMRTGAPVKAFRNYKDSLFRMIFREKDALLSLYNAVNGTTYDDPDALEIVTLENAIYMNMKNDLAFIINSHLNLYEHQSTFSPNMPLRNLFYISKELQGHMDTDQLYRKKQVKIPAPQFIVFYNGTQKQPERQILRLSDSFLQPVEEPQMELLVTMLNINTGKNQELLGRCRLLREYMLYVEKVRYYLRNMELEKAVPMAIEECIRDGILKEFLTKYRNEAMEMSIFEYNEETVMKYLQEDYFEEGLQEGIRKGRKEGRQEGETRKLIELVCRKLKKKKNIQAIADELEESYETIKHICEAADECGSEYDAVYCSEKIYEKLIQD